MQTSSKIEPSLMFSNVCFRKGGATQRRNTTWKLSEKQWLDERLKMVLFKPAFHLISGIPLLDFTFVFILR